MALHDAAMKDEYFIKRKLAPNVDFWYAVPSYPRNLGSLSLTHIDLAGGEKTNFPFYRSMGLYVLTAF